MKTERRFLGGEIRADADSSAMDGSIRGMAAVYYDGTEATEFRLADGIFERILPGAFAGEALRGDVMALFNHDENSILGRTSSGTLELREEPTGLAYEVQASNTTVFRDLREHIRRGDVNGSSFAFAVPPGGESWKREGTRRIRELRSVRVFDVGPVVNPAYKATTTHTRSVVGEVDPEVLRAAAACDAEDWGKLSPEAKRTLVTCGAIARRAKRTQAARAILPTSEAIERRNCGPLLMGPWAVVPEFLTYMASGIQSGMIAARAPGRPLSDQEVADDLEIRSGVAVVPLVDQLTKRQTSFGGTSMALAARYLRAAVANPEVRSILLHVDSPGGTVAGTDDLAFEVRQAARRGKPVFAHIDDLGASAAYWVASQAERISANPTGEVGSIGTMCLVRDSSGKHLKEGIRVHVVSTGVDKGSFSPGVPVSDDDLRRLQGEVDTLNGYFLRAVAAGRGQKLATVRSWGTGRCWVAAEARSLGLIDDVCRFDAALESARKAGAARAAV